MSEYKQKTAEIQREWHTVLKSNHEVCGPSKNIKRRKIFSFEQWAELGEWVDFMALWAGQGPNNLDLRSLEKAEMYQIR